MAPKISRELTEEERAALAEARSTYGDVAAMRARDGRFFIIRKCTQIERVRFIGELTPEKKGASADISTPNKTFAFSVLVFPKAPEEKTDLLNSYPFLCEKIADRAIELSEGEAVELGND